MICDDSHYARLTLHTIPIFLLWKTSSRCITTIVDFLCDNSFPVFCHHGNHSFSLFLSSVPVKSIRLLCVQYFQLNFGIPLRFFLYQKMFTDLTLTLICEEKLFSQESTFLLHSSDQWIHWKFYKKEEICIMISLFSRREIWISLSWLVSAVWFFFTSCEESQMSEIRARK